MARSKLFLLAEFLAAVFVVVLGQPTDSAGDKMTANNSIGNGQTLISAGGVFQLGFFSPVNGSTDGYIGIWYNNSPFLDCRVVWVANRNKSLNISTGSLTLTAHGNLILSDSETTAIWSTTTSTALQPVLQLQDSGNLVLTAGGKTLWQSFDHPTDTLLPGMKLGVDLRTNYTRQLVSWKNVTDPSPGDYTFKVETRGVPEVFIWNATHKLCRTGPWNSQGGFSGNPKMESSAMSDRLNFTFVSNSDEVYYTTAYKNESALLSRAVMTIRGRYERWNWEGGAWKNFWWVPEDDCDFYNHCGPNSVCTKGYYNAFCTCLEGFGPARSGQGCERTQPLSCSLNEFWRVPSVKLPDTGNATADSGKGLGECKSECLRDCSCTAYAISGPNGCVIWRGDLLDLRNFTDGGDDLYVRLSKTSSHHKLVLVIVPVVLGFPLLCFLCAFLWWRNRGSKKQAKGTGSPVDLPKMMEEGDLQQSSTATNIDASELNWGSTTANSEHSNLNNEEAGSVNVLGSLPSYDLSTIKAATNDFSDENKLGQGGFGVVYKGQLQSGQKIAVKKLSRHSSQGPDEFKNELSLIARLQHRNLVRLLGSCIEEDERIIILENMENKSLDTFIYDKTKSASLNWQKRLDIISGIARGLLYLHQDSILRVIHRDLKPSNILLDKDMNPKISDFGIARIFEGDEFHDNATTRPIGTFGYMAPEYISNGVFSFKSDVFSFGVIVLEILSGRRNRVFNQADMRLNLLGYAYKLWKEGRSLEILDDALDCSYPTAEILRCIRLGLLCVQENSDDRPTMAEVATMLASEDQMLIPLKQPIIASASSEGDFCEDISFAITAR